MKFKLIIVFLFLLNWSSFAATAKLQTFVESVVDQFEEGKYEQALGEIALFTSCLHFFTWQEFARCIW